MNTSLNSYRNLSRDYPRNFTRISCSDKTFCSDSFRKSLRNSTENQYENYSGNDFMVFSKNPSKISQSIIPGIPPRFFPTILKKKVSVYFFGKFFPELKRESFQHFLREFLLECL